MSESLNAKPHDERFGPGTDIDYRETTKRLIIEIEVLRGIAIAGQMESVSELLDRALVEAHQILERVSSASCAKRQREAAGRG